VEYSAVPVAPDVPLDVVPSEEEARYLHRGRTPDAHPAHPNAWDADRGAHPDALVDVSVPVAQPPDGDAGKSVCRAPAYLRVELRPSLPVVLQTEAQDTQDAARSAEQSIAEVRAQVHRHALELAQGALERPQPCQYSPMPPAQPRSDLRPHRPGVHLLLVQEPEPGPQ
jgi:hypothetical protein